MTIRHIQTLFLSLTALFLISCTSTPIKSAVVTNDFDAKGTTQELVTKTLVWVEKNPIIEQSTLQVHYHERGHIIGSGMTKIVNSFELNEIYTFTMQMDIKDNHAKIYFNNIILKEGSMRGKLDESVQAIKANLTKIAASYEQALTTN